MLRELYGHYRLREPMLTNGQGDRHVVPALDQLLAETDDPQLAGLADELTRPFQVRGRNPQRLRATPALALDFATWKRLTRQSLSDRAAADLMADLARSVQSG